MASKSLHRKGVALSGTYPDNSHSVPQLLHLLEKQLDAYINGARINKYDGPTVAEIAAAKGTLETVVLPKFRSLEAILRPINRLPKDIFIRIPHFFTGKRKNPFPMNGPLITMTHVCQSWRNVLLSTPSLWTKINFSISNSEQAMCFLSRSGNQLLDVYRFLVLEDHVEPFLSTMVRNIHRLRGLEIRSYLNHLELVLTQFTKSAPELKYLEIANDANITEEDKKLPKIFGGRLPKLTSLSLHSLRTNLRDFNFPSLTRFTFETGTKISVQDLTSFFARCPLLEFIQICLFYIPQPPNAPPRRRVCLAALQELRFDEAACANGLLDHLILPQCMEVMLKGRFTGAVFDGYGNSAARIHPSSIDHLPVTRGITKAVAMPYSRVLSGPSGNLRFWCFEAHRDFDAGFFTSFSPISVSEITELWVAQSPTTHFDISRMPWRITATGIHDVFGVLMKVEDLTIASCETEPFFTMLGSTVDDGIILLGLRRPTIHVGCGDLDISALIRCARVRKEHSRPLLEVTVVWEEEPGADFVQEVESLREFVGEVIYHIGEAPTVSWTDEDYGVW